jgi:aryl-alcohol dehydrogenase-like predicted oxidoreductase/enamine deaminase RidA (YjgF/YER057c/UK114 family)
VPTVERVQLAPGLEISRVVTGLWQIADMERHGAPVDPDLAARAMGRYVEGGLTTFDMADHYGTSELIAGRYAARAPGAAEMCTKWVPEPGSVSKEDVRAAVGRALERLRTDQLDLLQFHTWSYADPGWLDCVFFLDELRAEGLIRHIALTNTDTAHLGMLLDSGLEIVSNQVCYSLLDQRARGAMTELCLARNVKLLAFGTLAGGLLTERWLGSDEPADDELTTWSQMKYKRFIDAAGGWERFQSLLAVLAGVAERLDVSVANVATRYILDAPAVAGVIVGARLGESDHIEDTLRLFDVDLDDQAVEEIEGGLELLDAIPGDCGDEYRRPPFLTAAGDLSDHLDSMPAPYPTASGPHGRVQVRSGTIWEERAGFARAVRTGDRILVSGTTATHRDRLVGGESARSQTHFCIDKIEGAIQSLGGALEDVVRTRLYVASSDVAEEVSRVHGARLGHVRPANTLVQAALIGDGYLVEMEAEAVIGERG